MTTANNSNNKVVFAGGYDGEMVEIINACREAGVEVVDNHLGWGAAASAYASEIAQAASEGKAPVLVELTLDIEVPSTSIIVDHHNENVGKPASLLQVLNLIGVEPSREQQLIAANDCGYIPGMLALGATAEEVAKVRYADRAAQGITPEQEAEAERAIAAAETVNGVTIIRMAHSKTATVCDRLFNPEKEQRLLIISEDGESNFFGNGELCQLLQGEKTGKTPEGWDTYSNFGGWIGGNLPTSGFWGGYGDQKAVLNYIVNFFAK
ncbi:MAG: hypothetical protein IJV97_02450 [Alphaproteobacteria bacterium]|nr:hypothetical protein [Alphaproteobacteria bacterium]